MKVKISILIAAIVLVAGIYPNDFGFNFISSLSSGDCKGIASGDKSWCN